jgi:hypothetical protein
MEEAVRREEAMEARKSPIVDPQLFVAPEAAPVPDTATAIACTNAPEDSTTSATSRPPPSSFLNANRDIVRTRLAEVEPRVATRMEREGITEYELPPMEDISPQEELEFLRRVVNRTTPAEELQRYREDDRRNRAQNATLQSQQQVNEPSTSSIQAAGTEAIRALLSHASNTTLTPIPRGRTPVRGPEPDPPRQGPTQMHLQENSNQQPPQQQPQQQLQQQRQPLLPTPPQQLLPPPLQQLQQMVDPYVPAFVGNRREVSPSPRYQPYTGLFEPPTARPAEPRPPVTAQSTRSNERGSRKTAGTPRLGNRDKKPR